MLERRPNLFLLGAPKCGTTSVVKWLSSHPAVYFSPVKEPCHFNTDSAYRVVRERERYENLFRDASAVQEYLGEASVWYLYSRVAVANVLDYSPGARFLVCLRNPLELSVSLHNQQVFSGEESELDFERAWRLQARRARGLDIPALCKEPRNLLYGEVAKLGLQVQRLLETVERERVHFVFLEDLRREPALQYQSVLRFLRLDETHTPDYKVENVRRSLKSVRLNKALRWSSGLYRRWVSDTGSGLGQRLARLNSEPALSVKVSADLSEELADYFSKDIDLLSQLLGRDLTCWVQRLDMAPTTRPKVVP